jgi:tetratricopeptide (TPR) repeat protein
MQSGAGPRIFVSYSHDSEEHIARVVGLADRLIAAGCECELDQYESHPPEGWPQWMDRQLDEADFVLVVCTEGYYHKAKGSRPRVGRGVRFESVLIVQELYDAGMWDERFIPVLFDELADDLILRPLRGFSRYRVDQPRGFEDLLRHLTNQPRRIRPAPGPVPLLPPDPPIATVAVAGGRDLDDGGRRAVQGRAHVESASAGTWLNNLPFPSLGELFQGREEDLAEIEAELSPRAGERASVRVLVLYGLGGVGKTQLAVEHAWQVGERHRAVFFVRGESAEGLQAELAALAGPDLLDLPVRRERVEGEVASAVLRWLRENPGWLLIVDNVDTDESALAVTERLPRLQGGQVIVTSRIAVWPAGVKTREVLPISAESAARFLLDRTAQTRQVSGDEAGAAEELAKKLGGLPLALEQAAAYIGYHRMTLRHYLAEWEQSGTVLDWYDRRAMRYPRSLAVTWQTTIERLSPGAKALLRLAAHLAADPIPVEMLASGADLLEAAVALSGKEEGSAPAAAVTPAAALAELAAYSLLERGDTGVSVHRLVQEVTRARIPKEAQPEWAELAVRMVDDYAPAAPMDVRTWKVWDALRPHALEVIGHAERAGIGEPTWRLANQVGLFLRGKGLNRDAEPLLRMALELAESLHGVNHPSVGIVLNNLARLFQDTNRMAEAELLMRRALAISETADGREHPTVAIRLNNLATLLQETNRQAEAEPLMRRALAIGEAAYGLKHPNVATALNNLAHLFQETNRLAEAEPLMRRALAIDEAAYGLEHPEVATDLNNLAQMLQDTNRLAEAEPLMRRALAIDEAAYGPEHPRVATRLNNLAQLFQETNRLAEAEPLMRRALAIDEAAYGPDHPKVARNLNNLARLFQETNRLAEAEPLMRRALAIDEAAYEPAHPTVARRLRNLAQLLKETNRLAEAELVMRRALAIDEAAHGPEHPEVATDLNNLAMLLQEANRLAEAELLMRRALAIDEAACGSEHPEVATDLNNLAMLLQDANRLAEAEPLMRRSLAIDEAAYGPVHPKVARRLKNLAHLLRETNRLADAEPLMRRAQAIDEAADGVRHRDLPKGSQ